MRYSYNLRGTNGSGKTTVARKLIELTSAQPIEWTRPNKPLVYEGSILGCPIFFFGSYVADCGGCDTIDTVRQVAQLLHTYMSSPPEESGIVFFEGLMVSHMLGTVGEMQARLGKTRNVLAFLDTPLDVCISRVLERRARKGNDNKFDVTNVTKDHASVKRCRSRAIDQGYTVVDVPHMDAVTAVLEHITDLLHHGQTNKP